MIRRVRTKFISITMFMVTVMLILILGLQYTSSCRTIEYVSIQALHNASQSRGDPFRPGMPGPQNSIPCFALEMTDGGALLVSGDSVYDLSDTQQMHSLYRQARELQTDTGVLEEAALRFIRIRTPVGIKFVFTDISGEQQTLAYLLRNYIAIGTLAFAGFLLLTILLARWAVRPVEEAWQQQRQFVADASHELKTPLTVILTNAELLRDGRYTAEEKHRLVENIYSMSRQMRGLVESLLQLARADNANNREETVLLDLSELVQSSLLPFEPVYYEQGMILESRVEPGLRITGAEQQLKQLLAILLDNGCKYSAPGSTVTVELTRQSWGKGLLILHSPGLPMTVQRCEEIFRRFYRGDEARAMNHSYGLGLAIAREIARSHRGKIWAEPAQSGNVFYVSLPICEG